MLGDGNKPAGVNHTCWQNTTVNARLQRRLLPLAAGCNAALLSMMLILPMSHILLQYLQGPERPSLQGFEKGPCQGQGISQVRKAIA